MIGVGVAAFVLLVVWQWRRARKATLAGLNGDRPTFSVEPPRRSVGSRRSERL